MTIPWRRQAILTATVVLLLGAGLTDHARADGGGGSDSRENVSRGKPEDPDYTAAVRAIKADKYGEAIPLLQRVVGRDAQFGARAGVAFAEGVVVREPIVRGTLFKESRGPALSERSESKGPA